MYLKTLSMRGFKSFASATTLNFEPGITAIVGPNGSGKSNIVDALSWVMGEQGVKSLRGGKMEDIIFAGTSSRPPLGRAEVTLTIDNTDEALPIDFTEVTISRTMFRNGGSEYAINGQTCRLLDVQELLSDTGMGREMHVIVGQGQLDSILNATPEQRRGFIEEAAGVLKHRRRKEKAQRKLDTTQANLTRLTDLIAEIRRQLKPLGKQAEVARRAAGVQAELRDAKARLLADDLTTAMQALEADQLAEAERDALQAAAERALGEARQAEEQAEERAAAAVPNLSQAQEVWYQLTGLRERIASTLSIAAERVAHASDVRAQPASLRDPDAWESEARDMRTAEEALRVDIEAAAVTLDQASQARTEAEQLAETAERTYALALRAAADRREGLARLTGQVAAIRSRLEARLATDERLRVSLAEAETRTAAATAEYEAVQAEVGTLEAGQSGLDADFRETETTWQTAVESADASRQRGVAADQKVAALEARREALELSLGPDVSVQLKDAGVAGIAGRVGAHLSVEAGWEAAIAAALGPLGEAIVADDLNAARRAVETLKNSDKGRAALLLRGVAGRQTGQAPTGARWAADVVKADEGLSGALSQALAGIVVMQDLAAAVAVVASHQELTAVTRDGDVVSSWALRGGADVLEGELQAQAALRQTDEDLVSARRAADELQAEMANAQADVDKTQARRDDALALLNQSNAAVAGLAERLSAAKQKASSSVAEAGRLQASLEEAAQGRGDDEAALAGLEARLAGATGGEEAVEPDPADKDAAEDAARQAREREMEARLGLRTLEERAAALAGRADALLAAAAQERAQRVAAVERAERLRREAETAERVRSAALWLAGVVDEAVVRSGEAKADAEASRAAAQAAVSSARAATRERSAAFDALVEGTHRDEMARIEQRLRVESLSERALSELGLEADVLVAEYGPAIPVPVPPDPAKVVIAGSEPADSPEVMPYVREEQLARMRQAERDLTVLGRVNPLALEEFDAMSERHAFLAEQLDDVKRTRTDLLGIIDEVDAQVQEVFGQAYADVAETFARVFERLFPGGEGRLILTDPSDALLTGVDVEARPAGKKVKRLSLLSGGERSLVAVAFLLSLFIARPSPFYILDEVEAALDDVNLGRLLDIYDELRQASQLLIITHQKRTMEVADALYGITMRGDGVSKVVSQRLVDR